MEKEYYIKQSNKDMQLNEIKELKGSICLEIKA